ncbi:CmcJ/NvfI family oxidoreductase [Dinoroseobacter sp. S76]|uniref:CmcJ/NvfI family oxidoreductase n=1 Tax=Dinoroseobacter sp. S76 TaxID=3415124 RepID=UPI003C7D2DBD
MQTGTVNYHFKTDARQAYVIDAGGVTGELVSPPHDVRRISVRDIKAKEAEVSFARDGVAFREAPSVEQVFGEDRAWVAGYDQELTHLLAAELGARECVIFDHTVREDDPDATRRPARNVHSDYSPQGAQQRLIDVLGAERAAEWRKGRFGFVNVWRPVGQPINSAPLGFVRPASTTPEDWILIDLIYPDRRGHIMGLVASDAHEWVYASKMTPNEVAIFNIYDSAGLPSVGHSAIDLVEDPSAHTIRKSIESRTLVRY